MTKKIKPQGTPRTQRGIRGYGKWVSVTHVLSVVFEPIPENIKKSLYLDIDRICAVAWQYCGCGACYSVFHRVLETKDSINGRKFR